MSKDLLSQVIIALVNEHAAAKDYGVSLVTIPDFDYAKLACSIETSRQVQFFFLGLVLIFSNYTIVQLGLIDL